MGPLHSVPDPLIPVILVRFGCAAVVINQSSTRSFARRVAGTLPEAPARGTAWMPTQAAPPTTTTRPDALPPTKSAWTRGTAQCFSFSFSKRKNRRRTGGVFFFKVTRTDMFEVVFGS